MDADETGKPTEGVRLLLTADVAAMLKVPEGTLRWWRKKGVGPKFGRLPGTSRTVYREADVLAWIESAHDETPAPQEEQATPFVKLLSTAEAAEVLGIKETTLRWWRKKGVGPKSGRLPGTSKVVYREADLAAWVEAAFEDGESSSD